MSRKTPLHMESGSIPSSSRLSLADLCDQQHPSSSSSTAPMASTSQEESTRETVTSRPSSTMDTQSDVSRKTLSVSEEDESVMIAVRALDDMRSRVLAPPSSLAGSSGSSYHYRDASSSSQATPALSTSSSLTSPSMTSIASRTLLPDEHDASSNDFVSRVSGLPIVNTALRAYEQSKASSRVVKYGAEMVESSVKSISRPVIERLPVNQLDEFACRQLDRFGRYGRTNSRERSMSVERGRQLNSGDRSPRSPIEERSMSRSTMVTDSDAPSHDDPSSDGPQNQNQRDMISRSRWHSLLYEAGGIGAAVSEESMRRLKFCLQWLQYATGHIDEQILVLRNFIESLAPEGHDTTGAGGGGTGGGGDERPISATHMQTLTQVKRDVVGTIRQVVDVVSKYAGGALPEPARVRVREFILHLPQRWANTAHRQSHVPAPARAAGQPSGGGRRRRKDTAESKSAVSTAPSSPILTTSGLPLPVSTPGASTGRAALRPTAGSATAAAQRVLTLATESLDMMRSVTGIFKESLDRAETWVERLRMVGIQRQSDIEGGHETEGNFSDIGTTTEGSTTAGTSFPPSPRSYASDFSSSSNAGMATASLDALTINSNYATPKSSTSSLQALAELSNWDRRMHLSLRRDEGGEGLGISFVPKGRKPKDHDDESVERFTVERSAVSAIRGTASEPRDTSMDVDEDARR